MSDRLKRAYFQGTSGGSLKKLSGWKSFHRLPTEANSFAKSFVQQIAETDLESKLAEFHTRIRNQFGYRRKSMVTSRGQGNTTCTTPDFTLFLAIELDETDLGCYRETISVSDIANDSLLATEKFAAVFDGQFSQVAFEYDSAFRIDALIDTIEELEDPNLRVDYPPDARECTITFVREQVSIQFRDREMKFLFDHRPKLAAIAEFLIRGHALLTSGIADQLP